MTDNTGQIAYWNGPIGEKWARHQHEMDAALAGATAGLMPLAALKPGERVLDIGCGAGEVSLLAAEAVGPAGRVTGVDVSRPMLALARRRAEGRANLQFLEADAATHGFAPEFDVLMSRFGVMFFTDPVAAFANIRKAGAKNGRLAFICWRPLAENEWAARPLAVARPFLPPLPPPDPQAPGPFAFADAGRVRAILSGAGFRDIGIAPYDGVMPMGRTAEEAAYSAANLGPTARALAAAGDESLSRRVQEALVPLFRQFPMTDGVIAPRIACWLVSART